MARPVWQARRVASERASGVSAGPYAQHGISAELEQRVAVSEEHLDQLGEQRVDDGCDLLCRIIKSLALVDRSSPLALC
jgi:hypothetical protein